MGYEITFKIKEYDEKFKSSFRTPPTQEDLLTYKVALEGYCLYPEQSGDLINMHKIAKSLIFNLRLYLSEIIESWKAEKEKEYNSLQPDADGYRELYLCGWGFAHEDNSGQTTDTVLELIFDELFFITITPTPDKYASDDNNNRYHQKLSQIKEIIDEMEDSVYDIMNHEFLDFYRGKEDTIIEESY